MPLNKKHRENEKEQTKIQTLWGRNKILTNSFCLMFINRNIDFSSTVFLKFLFKFH